MKPKLLARLVPVLFVPFFMSGCSDGSGNLMADSVVEKVTGDEQNGSNAAHLDQELRELIAANNLTGNPAAGRNLPSITDPLAQLGMKLFFSKALGGQEDSACASCHHPALGGGDGLSLSIGVDAEFPDLLGPGRRHSSAGAGYDGGPTVPRNAPTTFNVGLWDHVMFHDGRIESLGKMRGSNGDDGQGIRTPDSRFGQADPNAVNLVQAQALFPVTSREEMRGDLRPDLDHEGLRDELASRLALQGIPNTWLELFQEAFQSTAHPQELISFHNISLAIGEYERSQVFVNNPWRAYVEGDDSAIPEAGKRGAILFFTEAKDGGAGCVACHSGDFFTDEQFHVVAMPQIGRGKGDGESGDDDFGRYRETGLETDRYAFRTPSLLNVSVTGPWSHTGAYISLEEVVKHHLDPAAAIDEYDFMLTDLDPGTQGEHADSHTRAALAKLEYMQQQGVSRLVPTQLGDGDIQDLVEFLALLTDPCINDRTCIDRWIPDTDDAGPDGLQLNAVDSQGNLL